MTILVETASLEGDIFFLLMPIHMRTSNLPRPNACSSLACIADVIQSSVSTGHPANSTNSRSAFTSLAFHVTIEDFTVPRNSKHIFLLRE